MCIRDRYMGPKNTLITVFIIFLDITVHSDFTTLKRVIIYLKGNTIPILIPSKNHFNDSLLQQFALKISPVFITKSIYNETILKNFKTILSNNRKHNEIKIIGTNTI
eukprot:TRINITY_DN42781_c0_g1_i1.p2 TRINITY_DN42781_c0_g1~~TRINITY_DN42781_c0_g1_i1.p2  ORF type:complete len:107 (+),score=12.48 TRINITY_DN42781_c0_g1_i1:66-386(+)